MSPSDIMALAIAMLLLAVVPGPGVLTIISRALSSGLRTAAILALGIVVGDLVFLMMAIFGLSYLAEFLGALFSIVKLAGGIYLIWLGLILWRSHEFNLTDNQTPDRQPSVSNFLSGLAITLGNPKPILFYLTFLPSFMDLSSLSARDITLTAIVVSSVLGIVLFAYAYTASRSEALIKNHRTTEQVRRTAGGMLIGIGAMTIARSD
ncbi:LysE family translocator [bacterium]|jgi:threonine/homoserine/homoserine lactone efflux protein|nr:LysE family translocator [bacterium]MDA7667557.1 LysE family translocator [bacterium]MDA7867327.1 LysE family translocator [Verrucomicrobiota bacterium]MDB4746542.1 LysE family translocator [Verrucomicrobiota bacterium]